MTTKPIETNAVVIKGTADEVLKDIEEYERLGVSRLILDFPSFVSEPQVMEDILVAIAAGTDMEAA